jgi:predicted nucleic acid-binding protein
VTRVFVDTSALIALLDRADPLHRAVRAAFAEMADVDLVTHGYVVAESLAVVRRRFGLDGAIALLGDILPVVEIVAVEPELHVRVQARYRNSLPSGISFVDQVSFAVIERDALDAALATDADFRAAGVPLIPAAPESIGLAGGGDVELELDGAAVRISPVSGSDLREDGGLLVIPAAGTPITGAAVRELIDADRHGR